MDHFERIPVEEQVVGGTATKDLLRDPATGQLYIAKTYESDAKDLLCLTEYAIYLAGTCLGVNLAEGGLGFYRGELRFTSKYFLQPGEELVHGVELFSQLYDEETVRGILGDPHQERSFFTVQEIKDAFGAHYLSEEESLFVDFVRLLNHDAIIGLKDRHSENWGVIVKRADVNYKPRLAPIYDSASGLFCRHREDDLKKKFVADQHSQLRLRRYIERSSPLVGWRGSQGTMSHIDLIANIFRDYQGCKGCRRAVLEMLDRFDSRAFQALARASLGALVSPMRIDLFGRCISGRIKAIRKVIDQVCRYA